MAIIILLSVSAVSATDNGTDDLVSATDQEVLSEDPLNFNQLQDIINGHTGTDPLILDDNYTYSGAEGEPKVVTITKSITIEGSPGKNITLNANNIAEVGIFKVDADGVVLNNINFIKATNHAVIVNGEKCVINNSHFYNNVFSSSAKHTNGPAVYWDGNDGTIDNSVFENNHISERESNHYDSGGAVCWMADNGVIKNSNFTNNAAFNGGAIIWGRTEGEDGCPTVKPKNGTIDNCIFIGNYVDKSAGASGNTYWAGAVHWFGPDGTIKHSIFDHNRAGWTGAIKVDNDAVNMKIFDCNFTFNEAYDPIEGSAGAVEMMAYNGTIYDCNFINNTAEIAAGALKMNNGATYSRVYNCNFTNNTAKHDFHGGAIEWFGANCNLTDSNFINNSAPDAGAIQWDGENGKVLNCNFTINTADGVAGAIRWDGENGKVINSNFTINFAENEAGAIQWNGQNGKVLSSNFAQNHIEGEYGGAISWNGEEGNVSYSNFTENCAYYGGAISWNGNNGDLSNSIFIKNIADGDGSEGGAVYYMEVPVENAIMRNCNFTDNSAVYGGGAISWNGDNGTFSNSNFINNTAEYGGAIGSWGIDLNITDNCNFTSNKATDSGGAIFIGDSSEGNYVSDNYFINNTAVNGGAVYWNKDSGSLTDSYFIGNNATEEGGAVYWQRESGTLSVSDFKDNSAKKGGAVYWQGECGILTDSNFISNNATENGGAVYWNGAEGTLTDSNFISNNATENGGAVYWNGSPGTLSSSNFTDNKATENGGAIYINYNGDYVVCKIDGSNFTSNSAKQGGAVYLLSNNPISRSTFTGNKATEKGGAIYNCDDGSEITESNFTSNTANDGGAVYCGADWDGYIYGSSTITFANFINNTAKQNGGAIYYLADSQKLENANFTGNTAVLGGAIFADANDVSIDLAYFNNNNATNGSAIYKTAKASDFKISNTLFERNQAHSKEITIDIEGNRTYALADVTVKISLVANDNIANAIWNDGDINTIELKNIQCEFSLDSKGRELKQFNVGDYYAPTGDSYGGDYKLWQNPLEDAQLIDIIIRNQTDVIYNITAGVLEKNSDDGILRALPDDSGLTVTKTDGSITIEFKGLKAGKYSVDAVHKEDAYYKEVANSDSFVIYNLTVNKTTDDVLVAVGQNVTYNITIFNNGDQNISNIAVDDLLPDYFELLSYSTTWLVSSETQQANPDFYVDFVQNSNNQFIIGNKVQDEFISMLGPHEGIVLTLVYNATKEGKYKNVIAVYSDSPDIIEVNSDNDTVVVPVTLNVTKKANETVVANNSLVDYTILVNNTSLVNITVFNMTLTGNPISYSINSQSTIKINGTKSFIIYGIDATCTVEDNYAIFKAGSGYSLSYMVQNADGTNITYFADGDEIKYIFNNVILNPENIVTKYETYTVKATNVTVVDTLPSGLTFVSADPVNGNDPVVSPDGKTITWTIDELSGPIEFNVTVRTSAIGNWTNNVTVNCNENKTLVKDNETVNVTDVILTVEKIVNVTDIIGNNTLVNFTIKVNNTSPIKATNVTVVDTLPSGLTFVSADPVNGKAPVVSADGKTITWTIDELSGPIEFNVTVRTSAIGNWTNNVTVNCNENKTLVKDNETVNVTDVILTIVKTANVTDMINGTLVNFTITVNNTSLLTATNVTVVDTLPVGLEYYSSDGFYNSTSRTVVWTIDNLSGSTNLWIVARATALGTLNNTVSVNCSENKTDVTANRTVNVLFANFTVQKTVDLTFIDANQTVNYTISIENTGEVNLTNIKVHDKFTDRFVLIDYSDKDKWSYNNDGVFTYKGNITVKGNATLVLVVQLTESGVYNNTVNVTSSEVENKTSTSDNTTVYTPSFNITKVVEKSPVIIGEQAVFTINVTNTGDRPINEVYVYEIYNSALIYDTYTIIEGNVQPAQTSDMIAFYIETLDVNESASFKVYFNTTVKGKFENNVTARFEDNENVKNASDEVTVEPIPTHTTVGNVTGYPGENVTIPVNVTADDGKLFTGQVNVTFPDGTSKIVDIINGTGNTTWKIPESYVPGDYPDHANYTGNETYLPSNGTGNVKVLPIPTNTTVGNVTGYPGQEVTIPVNVTTDDGKPFNGKVNVTLPDGDIKEVTITNGTGNVTWTIPSDLPTGNYTVPGNYSGNVTYLPSNGTGNVEVIPIPTITTIGNVTGYAGHNVTIPVNVTADDGIPFTGQVNVTFPDGTSKIVDIVNGTGSTVWKIPETYEPGDYPDKANFTGRYPYLPSHGPGYVRVIPIPTNTEIGNVTGTPGQNVTIPVNVTTDDGEPFNGTVNVTLPDGTTHEVNITNGTGNITWHIPDDFKPGDYPDSADYGGNNTYQPSKGSGVVKVVIIDVELKITVDRPNVDYGDYVEFIVTVHNKGPSDATGTIAKISIPEGFVYVSDNCTDKNYQSKRALLKASASSQSYDAKKGLWYIGDLANDETVKLAIIAQANFLGTKAVPASVSIEEPETDYTNNNGSVSVSVKPVADVQIVKTVDKTKIKPGDKVTYTFTVTNNGPNDATGVKVVDSQLTKFKFVKASSKDYNKNTGEWTIGKLANGSSVTLTVTVIIDKVGNYPNTATVSSNEKDSNMSNNKASSKVVSVVKVGGPHDKIKDHGSDKKTADKDAKSDSTVSKMHETGNPIFMALIVVLGLILLPLRRRK